MKRSRRGINPDSKLTGDGCVERLATTEGWWFHLHRRAQYGHIGRGDSSPSRHASRHATATGHPIIAGFEAGEDWFFNYDKGAMIKGVELLLLNSHRLNQPAPDRREEFHSIGNRCCTHLQRSFQN